MRIVLDDTLVVAKSVGGGLGSGLVDTADTGTRLNAKAHVAVHTPGGAPRVLDGDVLDTVINTVADSENTVVKVDAAVGTSNNTGGVELEGGGVSLDGNGDGSESDGIQEGLAVVDGDVVVVLDLNDTVTVVHAGGVEHSGVGVVSLGGHGGGLGVVEGGIHKTATAGQVTELPGAVHELLLGKGHEVASGNEVSTFHGTSGRERPAGTASALILDGGDGTSGNPVDRVSIGSGEGLLVTASGLVLGTVAEESAVLVVGQISELVDANGGGLALVGADLLDVGGELLKSEVELFGGAVVLAVLSDEVHELHEVGVEGGGRSVGSQGGSDEGSHL